VNGCAASTPVVKKRSEPVQADAELYDAEEMLSMTEEQLMDYEAAQADRHRRSQDARHQHGYLSGTNNGRYTVLAIEYAIGVFEQNARTFQSTDCRIQMPMNGQLTNPTAYCNGTDFINCLCWNTTCTGNAYGSSGVNGGSIPSNNLWVTLGTQSSTNGYSPERSLPGPVETNWMQIRGPRGYWTQNLTTCSWTRATWINATWQRVGNQYQCVPVLNTDNLALRVEEGLIAPPAPTWPDTRGHPTVTVEVDCTYPQTVPQGFEYAGAVCRQVALKEGCYCRVTPPQIFSLWNIISVRGEPSQLSQLTFKYTRPDQSRFSNQGVFRNVPSENLALGSGRESENMEDWVPGYNYFCMVADPLYAFNFNWGDFAYPWSTGEFEPRPNAVITNFNCDANVQPYAEQVFDWQEGLNMCRGCGIANRDVAAPARNPCLYTEPSQLNNRVCDTSLSLTPSTSYNSTLTPNTLSAEVSALCRVAWVLTGSDNGADLPLGEFFVIPYVPYANNHGDLYSKK